MRRKSKRVFETYAKFVPPEFKPIRQLPTLSPVNVMFSERTRACPSRTSTGKFESQRNSVMDPWNLQKESEEVREAILEKSRKIAPAYNKGAVQYVTDGTDLKTLGRKI